MQVHCNIAALRKTSWHEFATRFVAGGLITVCTGVIAKKFGVGIGGLFLAFPAILPASASLVANHEKKKKRKAGFDGTRRGKDAAALEVAGAARGSAGMLVFALLVWKLMEVLPPWEVLLGSALAWMVVAVSVWKVLRLRWSHLKTPHARSMHR